MKAYLIDPENKSVEVVDVGDWRDINRLLGSDVFTSAAVLANGDTLYVDDEGMFNSPDTLFRFGGSQYLYGKGLLLGADEATGESRDVQIPLWDVRFQVAFVEVVRFIKEEADGQKESEE